MPAHDFIGKTVGNYVFRRLLDQGGVGMVFIGEHRFLDERVAIKVLHSHAESNDSDIARRFFQEAKATRSVNHPNVVKIVDFGEDEKEHLLYLVMEFLEGESLAAVLERGPLDETTAVCIAAAVADGLTAAHERGIIHRDLKPGNIFMCSDGQVKLLDFGLAKLTAAANQTAVGMVVGTPQYMAPEQILKKDQIGPRTDVYGLAAVLFRMITGRLVFIADGIGDFVRQALNSQPPRASQFAAVSPELDALLLRCLEKEPLKRPASMVELKDLLTKIVERQRPAEPSTNSLFSEDFATVVDMQLPPEVLRAVSKPRPIVDPNSLPGGPPPGSQLGSGDAERPTRSTPPMMQQARPQIMSPPMPFAPPPPAYAPPPMAPVGRPRKARSSGFGVIAAGLFFVALLLGGFVVWLKYTEGR